MEEGHSIVGVDYRPKPPTLRRGITFFRANYNKRVIEDVFRHHQVQAVLHLGRVGNLKTDANKRFDLNVVGSAKIMELCLKHKVERLVVLSTFHIYGAHPYNHIPIHEEEPLRAGQTFPQLADAVQLDSLASHWVYRHRKLKTVVLRPCNIVGPHIQNAISAFLRQRTLPFLLGFSPMWQFIHEADMVEALRLALKLDAIGVYNVAGSGELPLVESLRLTGARLIPIPWILANLALHVGGRFTVPPYFLEFMRYPCVISDVKFRKAFGYVPTMGLRETIESTVHGA